METIVYWNAGGGSLKKEVERRPWFSGTQGGEVQWNAGGGSLNKEVEWRQ